MLSGQVIVSSAAERINHISKALLWFKDELLLSENFSAQFVVFVDVFLQSSHLFQSHQSNQKNSPTLHFAAVGKSGGVARLLVSMLLSVGVDANFLHPVEAFHGDLGQVHPGDNVILISNGGNSAEMLNLIPSLKQRSCRLLGITARPGSPLAKQCDAVLSLPPYDECCPLQQAPITSTVTTLALGQLLVAAVVEKSGLPLDRYALNHPGGSIGKRIFLKVDDLMSSKEKLPVLNENSMFEECVSCITHFSVGAALVIEAGQLVGLITEKDLRVSMANLGREVFDTVAKDLMNRNPVVVISGTLAIDALRLMENRATPLNVLPVVDKHRVPIGLVRTHDFISQGISLV